MSEKTSHLIDALRLAEKHIASVCDDVMETDLPDWFADLRTIRMQISIARGELPTTGNAIDAAVNAVAALRYARECLKVAKAPRALKKVRVALESAQGAVRAAEYRRNQEEL